MGFYSSEYFLNESSKGKTKDEEYNEFYNNLSKNAKNDISTSITILKQYIDKMYKNKEFINILDEMKNEDKSTYKVDKDKPKVVSGFVSNNPSDGVSISTEDTYWMSQEAYYYKSKSTSKHVYDFFDEIVKEIKQDKRILEIKKRRTVNVGCGDDYPELHIWCDINKNEINEEK